MNSFANHRFLSGNYKIVELLEKKGADKNRNRK